MQQEPVVVTPCMKSKFSPRGSSAIVGAWLVISLKSNLSPQRSYFPAQRPKNQIGSQPKFTSAKQRTSAPFFY